ncbi:MAG: polysaccharide deacetylase family protein [Candidatus Eremiobacteraeota bacterium]|nr:polysaccharide deacetylase family protein [Candidatus Eremiobacteraeota bacterium]
MRHLAALFMALLITGASPKTFVAPPILMYHRVDRNSPQDRTSRDLTVAPSELERQLAYLKAHRIAAISMADFENRLAHRLPLDHAVVLTFDDGYADQYSHALPLLRRFGDDATFYIITGELGKTNHLTWDELRLMQRDHMDIAAHGVKHDDLALMSDSQQWYQIATSIRTLHDRLHVPIESYAFPSGAFNYRTLAILKSEHIPLAVTTDPRYVIPPQTALELPRIRVHGWWSLKDFSRAIRKASTHDRQVIR